MLAGSILQRLVQGRGTETSGQTPLNFGVYYKNTLVALCHALEDAVLATKTSPLMVTAFQQGKWYLQEADRYAALADTAEKVVIMARPGAGFREHPTGSRPNVDLVDLAEDDPVAEEWHLMIMSSTYSAMVLCQELTQAEYGSQGQPENDLERKFYGFWTFDTTLVGETIALAAEHVGRYDPALKADLQARLVKIDAEAVTKTGEVGNVVMRVVDYLQESDRPVEPTETFKFADALSQNLASNELQAYLRMAQLADLADPTNPLAAAEVASLAEMMGQFLDLPVWQMQRLRLSCLLHRIAPAESEAKPGSQEDSRIARARAKGLATLRVLPRLRAIAQIIAHQREWWDGSGQPDGLAGDAIPLESRILGLVAAFQQEVARRRHQAGQSAGQSTGQSASHSADANRATSDTESEWQHVTDAYANCQAQAGDRWDPKLLEILGFLVTGLQQGLSLPAIPLKMTLSTGLLNPEVQAAWPAFSPDKETSKSAEDITRRHP